MADIPCSNNDTCNCVCNCQGYLTLGRTVTVGDLVTDVNDYTFTYTITNQDPAVSFVVFCVQCPVTTIEISSSNTSIVITGNPNDTPVVFTECFTSGCESSADNLFYVEYQPANELCCRFQGFKIDLNPADTITEIQFEITFTLPDGIVFEFTPGNMKIKTGQVIGIISDICMPGCLDCCNMQVNICELWLKEKDILQSNEEVFIHFAQLILPESLDLSTITVQELENKIRSIAKLEKSAANLICNVAKVLERLNELKVDTCHIACTTCK